MPARRKGSAVTLRAGHMVHCLMQFMPGTWKEFLFELARFNETVADGAVVTEADLGVFSAASQDGHFAALCHGTPGFSAGATINSGLLSDFLSAAGGAEKDRLRADVAFLDPVLFLREGNFAAAPRNGEHLDLVRTGKCGALACQG